MHASDDQAITGAFGTIKHGDTTSRTGFRARLLTLLAILGPGIIVMVGDNDAGGVSTYAQAGQNFGMSLLWVLPLLIPVLVVNQEMVVRLGSVTGVGHARLIRERYGKFWGTVSTSNLFVLNFATIATEFIGVNLALSYFHVTEYISVPLAALGLIIMTTSGSFRRWERFMFVFIFANFLVIPLAIMRHPSLGDVAHHMVIPGIQGGVTSDAVLLIIAIVGTTVAPWQLFFQQSNIVDKKITPRWINYERIDTLLGSLITVFAATLIIAVVAVAFAGTKLMGNYTDAYGVAEGLHHYVSPWAGAFFAIILLNASLIGAASVTLTTTYAMADVTRSALSLDRGWREAQGFYGVFILLLVLAAGLVMLPGAPLGLITTTVQALAGLLLPMSTTFLLLLCNDPEVLGPWVNRPWLNVLATVIVSVLIVLSFILMATTAFPHANVVVLASIMGSGLVAVLVVAGVVWLLRRGPTAVKVPFDERSSWRMPRANLLDRPILDGPRRLALVGLAVYLVLSVAMLLVKAIELG